MRISPLALGLSISTLACTADEIKLQHPGDYHIFPNTLCSEVNLSKISIEGRAFNPERDRLSIYGNGSIVIADGLTDPLVIYSEEDCQGNSMVLNRHRYYRSEHLWTFKIKNLR